MTRTYWTSVFSSESWREIAEVGFALVGFPSNKASAAERVTAGDVFICYLRGHSAFVGALEVTGRVQISDRPRIWSAGSYPVRLPVRPLVTLPEESAVSVYEVLARLDVRWSAVTGKPAWGGYFQSPPKRMNQKNAEVILEALRRRLDGKTPKHLDCL